MVNTIPSVMDFLISQLESPEDKIHFQECFDSLKKVLRAQAEPRKGKRLEDLPVPYLVNIAKKDGTAENPHLACITELFMRGYQEDGLVSRLIQRHPSVELFYLLKKDFGISHTRFSTWLGVKRRSSYNWLQNPESSTQNSEIERRLQSLKVLKNDMDPSHRSILAKIAFSIMYGDPRFGEAIIKNCSEAELLSWYDQTYDMFESYLYTLKQDGRTG